MATASLPVYSTRPMPWRILLAALAIVVVAVAVFSFTIGFSSDSSAKPATAHTTIDQPLNCRLGRAC